MRHHAGDLRKVLFHALSLRPMRLLPQKRTAQERVPSTASAWTLSAALHGEVDDRCHNRVTIAP
jgi:hypothetical protein